MTPDENAGDVIEGGRPPRRQLPRSLAIGLYVAFGVSAVVWGIAVLADGGPETVAEPTPTPTLADDVPVERSSPDYVLDCRGRDRAVKACAKLGPLALQNAPGRHSMTLAGVPFSFRLPSKPDWENGIGWVRYSSNYISQDFYGDQVAEAVVYWTAVPGGGWADPCARPGLLDLPVDQSSADLAVAVSSTPGTKLVSGPTDVTLGGVAAKHVVLDVRKDAGCDPGYFYTWKYVKGGPFWPTTDVGDTIRVWIVSVDGGSRSFLIVGETKDVAGPVLTRELQRIARSFRFA